LRKRRKGCSNLLY